MSLKTLAVSRVSDGVFCISLDRPEQLNALEHTVFKELPKVLHDLQQQEDVRAIILNANGKHFCAGIDLKSVNVHDLGGSARRSDVARRALHVQKTVRDWQRSLSAVEEAAFPVIAAVHGACIGGGVDLISACDIRLCTEDAFFSVKEVDIGMAADLGTLQRLPKIVGSDSWVREVALTARQISSDEALKVGLVSQVLADRDTLFDFAVKLARNIAAKSPVAVATIKNVLNFSRDQSTENGLKYVAACNAAMLQTDDIPIATLHSLKKSLNTPLFSRL